MTKRTRRVINMQVGDPPLVLTAKGTASGNEVSIYHAWSVQYLNIIDGTPSGTYKETIAIKAIAPGVSDVTCTITMGMSETIAETVTFCVGGSGMVDTLEITGGSPAP